MKEKPTFTFICKPDSGKGGEGIFLVERFRDIPNKLYSGERGNLLVQRYIKTPLLIDNKKKFDLRLYVLIKGFNPIEAYLCDEGLARFCTEDYQMPTNSNLKNLFMHLTNYSLNKNSEKYVQPDEDFLEEGKDTGTKRLLSSLWKTLEEEGHDVEDMQESIRDTVRKSIISLEPYLYHYYRRDITKKDEKIANSKVFHILGLDVLIDRKNKAWLMEINSNPSLNIFLERDIPGRPGETTKELQELDKHVKAKVVTETIRIVCGQCEDNEYEGSFEQLLPCEDGSMDHYYIWNQA
jgi:tubulin polyglutamylase TTLL11